MSKPSSEHIRRPLEAVIFYGTLTVIGLTSIPFGTVDPFWEAAFEAAVFGLTILWLIDGLYAGLWWQRDHLLLIPLFALVLFALVQSVSYGTSSAAGFLAGIPVNEAISADPFESRRFALKLLAISLTLGLLLRYTSSFRRVRFLIYLIVGIALGSALFGLLKYQLFSLGFDSLRERLSSSSTYAQFDNRNHFAFLMEAAIGLLLGVAIAEWRRLMRLASYSLMAALMWVALLHTQSRGAVVSLITEVTVFCFLLISIRLSSWRTNLTRFQRRTVLIAGVITITFVIGVVGTSTALVGGDEMVRRFELTPSEFADDQAPMRLLRPQIWRATLGVIKDNPLVGTGFGAFSIAIPGHLNASGEWTPAQAHNDYLELLASGGLIGGLLALWFVSILIRMVRRQMRQTSGVELAIRCGALAGLCGIAIHSMFDFGLHITINALVCVALIVLAVRAFNVNLTNDSVKTQAA